MTERLASRRVTELSGKGYSRRCRPIWLNECQHEAVTPRLKVTGTVLEPAENYERSSSEGSVGPDILGAGGSRAAPTTAVRRRLCGTDPR